MLIRNVGLQRTARRYISQNKTLQSVSMFTSYLRAQLHMTS
jgi:hypothetical protein